jgi:hypothetical protein
MKSKIENLNRRLNKLLKKIHQQESKVESIKNIRLSLGVSSLASFLALIVWPASPSNPIVYFAFSFTLLFLLFVKISTMYKGYLKKLKSYFLFLERQDLRKKGIPSGLSFKNAPTCDRDIPYDLNLIGEHSLLSLLDETWTQEGLKRILSKFESESLTEEMVLLRQKLVKSLNSIAWPLIRLRLNFDKRIKSHHESDLKYYLELPIWRNSPKLILAALNVFWLIWILLLINNNSNSATPLVALSFPLINLILLQRWSNYFKSLIPIIHHLDHLLISFSFILRHKDNYALQEWLPNSCKNSPIKTLKQLEFASIFLGTEVNPILHFILNALTPWSAVGSLLAYRSISKSNLSTSIEELPNLEVLVTYGIFIHYQTQVYPVFNSDKFFFEELIHPLIPRDKVVNNSFSLPSDTRLVLLTGSNMSGKSTFLRAIGINQLLANMGLPVFAKSFVTLPFQIQSCIEVADSIRDGFSYFYSEVKKLSYIDKLTKKDGLLMILVDELFRGTNNAERRTGSRGLIKKWSSRANTLSFISSHDLDLAKEATQFKGVACYHFTDDIDAKTNKMHFDYKIHPGPSTTTNALKIMQIEGLLSEAEV